MGVLILISVLAFSVLTFIAGFIFSILCLVSCTDEKWRTFRDAVEEKRRKKNDTD